MDCSQFVLTIDVSSVSCFGFEIDSVVGSNQFPALKNNHLSLVKKNFF